MAQRGQKLGGLLRAGRTAPAASDAQRVDASRREVAAFCKLIGRRFGKGSEPKLSPRARQTLERLLAGDSEKQIAAKLQLSQNTVHVYVKSVYRSFGVSSRGELLARFVGY